jgi:hypothetical protein
VTTSIDAASGGAKISWTLPDIRGSPIIAYKVEVLNKLGSWIENKSKCDGTSNLAVTSRYCLVGMLDLY